MLAGKDLIIQHAAGLTDAVQNELDDLMEKDRSGMIVVLIDTPENLEALHAHIPLSQVNSSTLEAMRKRLNRKSGSRNGSCSETFHRKTKNRSPAMW